MGAPINEAGFVLTWDGIDRCDIKDNGFDSEEIM
jgi:hypothetical protein